jgi:hypothetical protein
MSVAPTFYRQIVNDPQPTAIYQARHDRINQFGSTLAKDFGAVVLKAEAVYTRGRGYEVTTDSDPNGVVEQNNFTWVLGLDYTEIADTRVNVQLFQSHVFDRDPGISSPRPTRTATACCSTTSSATRSRRRRCGLPA